MYINIYIYMYFFKKIQYFIYIYIVYINSVYIYTMYIWSPQVLNFGPVFPYLTFVLLGKLHSSD